MPGSTITGTNLSWPHNLKKKIPCRLFEFWPTVLGSTNYVSHLLTNNLSHNIHQCFETWIRGATQSLLYQIDSVESDRVAPKAQLKVKNGKKILKN